MSPDVRPWFVYKCPAMCGGGFIRVRTNDVYTSGPVTKLAFIFFFVFFFVVPSFLHEPRRRVHPLLIPPPRPRSPLQSAVQPVSSCLNANSPSPLLRRHHRDPSEITERAVSPLSSTPVRSSFCTRASTTPAATTESFSTSFAVFGNATPSHPPVYRRGSSPIFPRRRRQPFAVVNRHFTIIVIILFSPLADLGVNNAALDSARESTRLISIRPTIYRHRRTNAFEW